MTKRDTLMLEKEKLNCLDVFKVMGELTDSELGSSLVEKLSLHIKACEPCQKFQDEYRELGGLITELRSREYVQTEDDKRNLRAVLASRLGI